MNVTKIILTRCQIFYLKCTKFNFGWASLQTPLRIAYSVLPYILAEFGKGKGKRWKARKEEKKGKGRGEGKGRADSDVARKGHGVQLHPYPQLPSCPQTNSF